MVQVNIKNLIDDGQCYQTVRELHWPDGITCPSCESTQVIKRGFDDTELARQRYECTDCHTRCDDWVLGSDGTSNRCKPAITFAELYFLRKKAAYGGMGLCSFAQVPCKSQNLCDNFCKGMSATY